MKEIWIGPGVEVATDSAPADWLQARLLPWGGGIGTRVGSVIPTGFQRYARVFHPAPARRDDEGSVTWSEVALWAGKDVHPQMQWEAISQAAVDGSEPPPFADQPAEGYCPPAVRGPLTECLTEHTTTPESCWACVWEGYGRVAEAFPHAPRVQLPGRDYILLSVTLEAIAAGVLLGRGTHDVGPNLWWPEDRAWCVSTEIDFCWTYVAGTDMCIEDVLRVERLEALVTQPDHRGDFAGDVINGHLVDT